MRNFTLACAHRDWRRESSSIGIAIYDDRIEVENAGRFPYKLSPNVIIKDETVQEKNASDPPNPIIADVLYYSGLIEQWGRGIALMFDECKRVNAPAPRISDDGFIVRVVFPRPDLTGTRSMSTVAGNEYSNAQNDISRNIVDSENDISRSEIEVQSEYSNTLSRTVGQVFILDPTPGKFIAKLILKVANETMTAREILDLLNLRDLKSFRQVYLNPALAEGYIKPLNESSPTAPNQRYRLTDKGMAYYYKHRQDSDE